MLFRSYLKLHGKERKVKSVKDFRSHRGVDLGISHTEGTNEKQVFLPAQEANHFLFCNSVYNGV